MSKHHIYTAESVTEGHPDKLCDLIADTILDECLKKDKNARVACEVMATRGKIIVAGEITAAEQPDIRDIVKRTVREVGYDDLYDLEVLIHGQSEDIADAINGRIADVSCAGTGCMGYVTSLGASSPGIGAGDQGIMYGYATADTEEMLPLPCILAHRLALSLELARKSGAIENLLPDGKAQVSIEYDGRTPVRIAAIVLSCQHESGKDLEELRREVREFVIAPALAQYPPDENTEILINPSGRFVLGGPDADTGLTGRKLAVDTYGGFIQHGGGALSGKDGTKVDRSGAYMARYVAKNIIAAGLAEECTVSAAYAIGKSDPVALSVDTHGTGEYENNIITQAVRDVFDFRPLGMIRALGLNQPVFASACCYGHFMKAHLPWEQIDQADALRLACKRLYENSNSIV